MEEEIWKDIIGYENKYKISNFGRVLSLNYNNTKKPKVLKQRNAPNGRPYINLSKNGRYSSKMVHRLVLTAFLENPENKSQINHKDGDIENNKLSNLEWCTASENMQHAVKNGLIPLGEDAANAKLSNEEVTKLRLDFHSGIKNYSLLGSKYKICRQYARSIALGIKRKAG